MLLVLALVVASSTACSGSCGARAPQDPRERDDPPPRLAQPRGQPGPAPRRGRPQRVPRGVGRERGEPRRRGEGPGDARRPARPGGRGGGRTRRSFAATLAACSARRRHRGPVRAGRAASGGVGVRAPSASASGARGREMRRRVLVLAAAALLASAAPALHAADAGAAPCLRGPRRPAGREQPGGGAQRAAPPALTVLAIAPSILILMTCFLRIAIVFDFIKRALSCRTRRRTRC